MRRSLVALAVVVAALFVAAPAEALRLPPCSGEYGAGPCVWDAVHLGNGTGKSFIRHTDGRVEYVSHPVAHQVLYGSGR